MTKQDRGRPAMGPTTHINVSLPDPLLAQVDALRGDVPRLALIRRVLREWVEAQPPASRDRAAQPAGAPRPPAQEG